MTTAKKTKKNAQIQIHKAPALAPLLFLFISVMIVSLPTFAEASSSLGTIQIKENTINATYGQYIQVKLSYFNKGDTSLRINLSYEPLDEGTRYDLVESAENIHILKSPYPSEPVSEGIILPPCTKTPTSSQGRSWVALDTTKTYSEIKSVYLLVNIPSTIVHVNPYRIKVSANTMPTEKSTSKNKKTVQPAQSIIQQMDQTITIYSYPAADPRPSLDSDYDGLTDYEEVNIYHTNPMKKDTDEDGVSDGREI